MNHGLDSHWPTYDNTKEYRDMQEILAEHPPNQRLRRQQQREAGAA